ncbi:hypothetical protein RRG08_013105 [Elysia crispata]|uniref:Uncharacterized protein n=1 Tax=Elysia crispata TaxID=231223 RepID=A0AAE1A004_9GAST|nr:hypothetical protein RRG08_013105 [Elysia crispata]
MKTNYYSQTRLLSSVEANMQSPTCPQPGMQLVDSVCRPLPLLVLWARGVLAWPGLASPFAHLSLQQPPGQTLAAQLTRSMTSPWLSACSPATYNNTRGLR